MGYTHYWHAGKNTQTPEINELWGKALEIAGAIVRHRSDIVQYENDDDRAPETGDGIVFNGIEEEGHETFVLPANSYDLGEFDFCKTVEKPYDIVVTAVLATMKYIMRDAIVVSSDGDPNDWLPGSTLARQVTGRPIGLPADEAAWAMSRSDGYRDAVRKDHREITEILAENAKALG